MKVRPFSIKDYGFKNVFTQKNGFNYIVGNPPYGETKHYKLSNPKMHTYLSEKYSVFEGKADLAIIFIERCIELLNLNGKLGFIVQKRWFKTDYGTSIRNLIEKYSLLETLIDFKATDLFPKHITYVAIVILKRNGNNKFNYHFVSNLPKKVKELLADGDIPTNNDGIRNQKIPASFLKGSYWSPEFYEVEIIKQKLIRKFGNLSEFTNLDIDVGIQVLWNSVYHIIDFKIDGGLIKGKNKLGVEVELELSAVKALYKNNSIYSFKKLLPTAYCIFPYCGDDNKVKIPINDMPSRTRRYLLEHKKTIKENVQCRPSDEFWHTFTRENNLASFYYDKILFPMTALDTFATYLNSETGYLDNANVYFITIKNTDKSIVKAITSIINSTAFSVFAKAGANPQSGGYFKFNK